VGSAIGSHCRGTKPWTGDQIGQNFAHWAIVPFRQFFWKIKEEVQCPGYFFPRNKQSFNFGKNSRATFLATFSKTHLVALTVEQSSVLSRHAAVEAGPT
jgi:hypothetical protein